MSEPREQCDDDEGARREARLRHDLMVAKAGFMALHNMACGIGAGPSDIEAVRAAYSICTEGNDA